MSSGIISRATTTSRKPRREKVVANTKQDVMERLKQIIRPEFLNRIDETVMFTPLDRKEILEIVEMQVHSVKKMLSSNGITLEVTRPALELLAEDGYDPEFGPTGQKDYPADGAQPALEGYPGPESGPRASYRDRP